MFYRRVCLYVAFSLLLAASPVRAERPSGPNLLPDRTVALVRIRNFPETRAKFAQTAMGRILSDPEVGPLMSKMYEQAQEMYAKVEERVGVPLDRLLALPQGEIWVAVVPPAKDGPIAVALLIDVGDQIPTATRLIKRGEEFLSENGGSKVEETLAGAKVNIFVPPGVAAPQRETKRDKAGNEWEELVVGRGTVVQYEKDGAIVVATTATLAEEIIKALEGNESPSLAQNEHFAAVMNRCQVGSDPPGFEWYVDPVNTARALARGNVAAQTGLALIPALGLDGVRAVGGTMTFGTGEFDGVGHTHLLLDDPKSGALELLQMSSGDATPESWVPSDVVTYMTLHWDLQATYAKGTALYDSFPFGDQKAADIVRTRVKNALDVDFETEILPALDGRATLITWNEPPARLNSQANLVGLKLTDAKVFQATLEKIMAKYPEALEKKTFGSTTYYRLTLRMGREGQEPPENIRAPEPLFAIVGDYLLASDSVKFFEHCVTTTSTGKTLSGELDYKLIASKISRQAGGQKPGLVIFTRPEEGLRMLYELANSESTRKNLSRQAENNEFFKRLEDSLKEHPLPPFAVITKYLAPSGAMMTQDETGFHYMSFTLKRK